MQGIKSEYDIQAEKFLKDTNTIMSVKFLRHGLYFNDIDPKQTRDIYEITFKRGSRSWSFEFGQSIDHSGRWLVWEQEGLKRVTQDKRPSNPSGIEIKRNAEFKEPSEYDVLACITKDDPYEFSDFCSNFGYETDSIKAHKIYNAVEVEWLNIQRMWTDKEIEKLREIA